MRNITGARLVYVISVILFFFPANDPVRTQSLQDILSKAYDYESGGKHDLARMEAVRLLNDSDSNWFDISKYLISLNNIGGFYQENIKLFNEGHSRGYFYFIHPLMPEYKPYLSLSGFDSVSSEDLRLRDNAIRVSHTLSEVQLPFNYDPKVKYPLIYILHGGGRSIESVKRHWQVSELNRNFIKVYLQSYRHFDYNTYGWGSGDERLDKEVRAIADSVMEHYSVDTSFILTAGISAGAAAAIDLAVRSVIPATGFLVYCPDLPSTLRSGPPGSQAGREIRGYICAGENDHFRPRQEVLTAILDSLGITTKYDIVPQMGHAYPKNENYYINEGLKFIYKRKTLVNSDFEARIEEAISGGVCRGLSVAGIIGAKGDNGKGISGIAWNVSLMLLKAPSSVQFGFSSDTAKAYCYAEAIRYAVDNGARIINWSGTLNDNSEYATKTIGEAFIYAEENNVLIVVAAGSQAVDLDLPLNYAVPASINMSNLVKVTELDFQGDLYKYRTAYGDTLGSSFGLKSVTLGAIGENYTTWDYHSRSCYALGAGTSCSGPVVAGCAALMLSVNPELTPSEIRRILIETATPIESLGGITESGGAVNIYGAVKMAIDYRTSAESIHNN